jgi:hypothetical protein
MKKKRVEIPMEIRRLWSPDSEIEQGLKVWRPKKRSSGNVRKVKAPKKGDQVK